MSSAKPTKATHTLLLINASSVVTAHTYLAFSAFITALLLACLLHYKKVVRNDVAKYPEEWFPSVSATIGDWYPERSIFQIVIALTSGPRFALILLRYYLMRSATSSLPTLLAVLGVVRTLACGGWVYITSSDDHDVHDFLMIVYIVLTLPWMLGGIATTTEQHSSSWRKRVGISASFFATIVPLVYFYIQHKIQRVPGAYTHYSLCEWSLIVMDILYDAVSKNDLQDANLQIVVGRSVGTDPLKIELEEPVKTVPVAASKAAPVTDDVATRNGLMHSEGFYSHWFALRSLLNAVWRRPASFLSDVYLVYISWSIFTSLAPSLFYFSVWELGIAGHELALLSTLAPILLTLEPFLTWARTKEGLLALHVLSFVGLLAYISDKPLARLFMISFATAVLVIKQAVEWTTQANNRGTQYQGVLFGLGLTLSSLLKHANHSNNPVWPIVNEATGGYNKTGLFLAALALCELATRPPPPSDTSPPPDTPKCPDWLPSAIALGGLIFSYHSLLSDSSTLVAWSWTGFSHGRPKGPLPNLHGALTLIAQCLGLLIAVSTAPSGVSFLDHPIWYFYGAGSAYIMYAYKHWLGYAGGFNVAIFLMSITPGVVHRAGLTSNVGKSFFATWLVVGLFDLAHVWTVAYAFVPGGVYLRERTDLVLFAQMATLAFAFNWPRRSTLASPISLPSAMASYTRTLLAATSVLTVLVTLYRLPSSPPIPYKPGPRIVTAGIWTLHFGFDNKGRDSQRGVRNLIHDMQLDIVGLLETDLHRVVFGNRDLTRLVAEELGYYVDTGPGPNLHTWGAALLSKYPIINSTHYLLPSPRGELAPAIEAVLDVYGTHLTVVVAHNGQEEDPLDRELQSRELARIMAKSYPQPVIFLGYVVTVPGAAQPAPYDILVADGRVHDIDSDDWDRWCEYIFYRGLYRTGYARLSRGEITDTELQVGRFVVPRHGFGVTNDTKEARYLRHYKEILSVDHWFPMKYYAELGGTNGHTYHVFGTPLYYRIPEGAIL